MYSRQTNELYVSSAIVVWLSGSRWNMVASYTHVAYGIHKFTGGGGGQGVQGQVDTEREII